MGSDDGDTYRRVPLSELEPQAVISVPRYVIKVEILRMHKRRTSMVVKVLDKGEIYKIEDTVRIFDSHHNKISYRNGKNGDIITIKVRGGNGKGSLSY